MGRFLYVFSEDARDKLLSRKFEMIKEDKRNNIFIFLNQISNDLAFSVNDISYIESNTLTF